MIKNITYVEYEKLYPKISKFDNFLSEKTQVLYFDYDYVENQYEHLLDDFVSSFIDMVKANGESIFLVLISNEVLDTNFNRNKKLFTKFKSNNCLFSESYYSIDDNSIIKIAVIKLLNIVNLHSLLVEIIKESIIFLLGFSNLPIQNYVFDNFNFSDCFKKTIGGLDKTYLQELITCFRMRKLFKYMYVYNGGFDYGQFAFLNIT